MAESGPDGSDPYNLIWACQRRDFYGSEHHYTFTQSKAVKVFYSPALPGLSDFVWIGPSGKEGPFVGRG